MRLLDSNPLSSWTELLCDAPVVTVRNQRKETTQKLSADLVRRHLQLKANWGLIAKWKWINPTQTFLGQKKKKSKCKFTFFHIPLLYLTRLCASEPFLGCKTESGRLLYRERKEKKRSWSWEEEAEEGPPKSEKGKIPPWAQAFVFVIYTFA